MNGTPQHAMPGDVPLESIAGDVHQAREAILATIRADPNREWLPGELMEAAKSRLRSTVVSIAFWNLVENGDLDVDEHLVVRLVHLV